MSDDRAAVDVVRQFNAWRPGDQALAERVLEIVAPDVAASDHAELRRVWLQRAREVIDLVRRTRP